MNEKYAELIAGYLNGELNDTEQKKVEQLLESGEIDLIDFKAMEQLHDELEIIPAAEPSAELSDRFYTMLEEKKSKNQKLSFNIAGKLNELIAQITMPKLAYAFVLLIIGGFIGAQFNSNESDIQELTAQMQNMQEMMVVSMLEGASTTDRLKAVNISTQLPTADEKAIRALIFTLNHDESTNVRVQSVEALKKWGENESVRRGLVNSISSQDSDVVIIALADAMVELGLQNSKQEFENIINERELNINVKQKLESTIAML